MLPLRHLILGILFALILLTIFPKIGFIGFFIILASTVLIDIDHYFYYIYKEKNFSFKKAYNWFVCNGKKYNKITKEERKNIFFGFCIFHGIEAIIFLFFLFVFFKYSFILYALTGFVFHQFLDLIELVNAGITPYKVLSSSYSLFYSKNKVFLGDYKLK